MCVRVPQDGWTAFSGGAILDIVWARSFPVGKVILANNV